MKRSQPILFSVRESARFPRALWDRFRDRAEDERQPWIDVLRRAVERYLETPRHENHQDE